MLGVLFIAATAAFLVYSLNQIWTAVRDPLHPAFLFSIPLIGMYVAQPLLLLYSDSYKFGEYLKDEHFTLVAAVNAAGVVALMMGVQGKRTSLRVPPLMSLTSDNSRLFALSLIFGIVSAGSYIYTIYAVGGFTAAYRIGYGGGWSDVGYIREAYWLSVPALTLLAISRKRFGPLERLLAIAFALPLVTHGILGARRGPTAAAFITFWLSRSLATGRRPTVLTLFLGMGCLGCALLFLVANRDSFRLDMTGRFDSGLQSYSTKVGSSNEYIYGGAVIITSHEQNVHYYGRRYLVVIFVRPIPVQLFPSKYAFAAEYLAIPNLSETGSNLGTGNLDFIKGVGWRAAVGAAPGLVADLWLEFWFGYVVALWGLGRFYWFAWHRLRHGNRFWIIGYTVMAALSIYLITQTLEAMLFRFLLASGAVVIMWFVSEGRLPRFDWRLLRRRRHKSL